MPSTSARKAKSLKPARSVAPRNAGNDVSSTTVPSTTARKVKPQKAARTVAPRNAANDGSSTAAPSTTARKAKSQKTVTPHNAASDVSARLGIVAQDMKQSGHLLSTHLAADTPRAAEAEPESTSERILRLDALENSRIAVLERTERMIFVAESTLQILKNLFAEVEDALERDHNYKALPERARQQVLKAQEQAKTMQTSASECASELGRVYAGVTKARVDIGTSST
ncbi:hypothetical protein EXIGLDRAFT_782409 [Exidia glandulosa HHB12029]|uniref:Uncharacterized protein n=1 Tax=Exidia glandulosa HHB12029 TaxID=1314781 RepID=A0A165ATX8_EXIGL|nr:hypothetical protein EXIGLDRAFT_782409 [Exidia glandulosa HHB12029]